MKRFMNIIDEENNTGKYEILCSFDSGMTLKSYVFYTDDCKDDEGKIVILTGAYEQIDENTLKVDKNLTNEEFEMISNVMNTLIEQVIKLREKNEENSVN